MIARSDPEEIKNWAADPPAFAARKQNTWLVMADQIPFWIQIGMLEHIYADYERGRGTAKEQRDRRLQKAMAQQQSQRFLEKPEIPEEDGMIDGDREGDLEDEEGEEAMEDSDREGDGMIDGDREGDLLGSLEDPLEAMSDADPDQEPESKGVKIEDGDREDSLGVAELGLIEDHVPEAGKTEEQMVKRARIEMEKKGDLQDNDGLQQKRGAERSGEQERMALDARLSISGLWGPDDTEIMGHILPSILI